MMEKSGNVIVDGENFQLSVPFAKINKEQRIVSGWATLDNVDAHGDRVTHEANIKAFAKSKARIRESHQPIAVGKILDFKEDSYYDKETGKLYKGIYVNAYISKGAQDTWEKVIDGTLAGFSIGGRYTASETVIEKGYESPIRVITEYDLHELSLVDNPANPMCSIMSISKSVDGDVEFMTEIENVFYCPDDELAKSSKDDKLPECVTCGKEMRNIGWFEKMNDTDIAKAIQGVITEFTKGGVEMTEQNNEEVADNPAVEAAKPLVPAPSENAPQETTEVNSENSSEDEAGAEESSDPKDESKSEEVEVDETGEDGSLTVLMEKLKEDFNSRFEAKFNEFRELANTLQKSVDALNEKVAGVEEKPEPVTKEDLETLKKDITGMNDDIEKIKTSGAFKKSVDLGGSTENEAAKPASVWGGSFLGVDSLE